MRAGLEIDEDEEVEGSPGVKGGPRDVVVVVVVVGQAREEGEAGGPVEKSPRFGVYLMVTCTVS